MRRGRDRAAATPGGDWVTGTIDTSSWTNKTIQAGDGTVKFGFKFWISSGTR